MASKNIHYIDNTRFELVIAEYTEGNKTHEDELASMLDMLVTNVFYTFKFRGDIDDAKQDCFVLILRNLPKFNNEKGGAFNYFTTMILNHLKLIYTKEKKYQEKITNFQKLKSDTSPYPTSSQSPKDD